MYVSLMLVAQETTVLRLYKYGIFTHNFRKDEATMLNPERLSAHMK